MEWININERLPEIYKYVLVASKKDHEPSCISIARYDGKKWEMLTYTTESNAVACGDLTWYMEELEITHWMELPELPKE